MQPPPATNQLTLTHNNVKHIVRYRTPDGGIQFPLTWTITTYCNQQITGITDATLHSTTGRDTCPACLAHHQYANQRTRRSEPHATQ